MKKLNSLVALVALVFSLFTLRAVVPEIPTNAPVVLNSWLFDNSTNWLVTTFEFPPLSYTNVEQALFGDGYSLFLDKTNAAWLRYNVYETNSAHTNLTVNRGTVMFWFAPNWNSTNAGGTGPGDWASLIEVGEYTTNASYGLWSLYIDPAGTNIYFSTQTNGAEATYLTAPISWTNNYWHFVALAYSSTNSALYLDGVLSTNGPGVTNWPSENVLSNGFWIGSDSSGLGQAHGTFDDILTYDGPLEASDIAGMYSIYSIVYYGMPMSAWNLTNAASLIQFTPTFKAITGAGYLAPGTNATGCFTNSRVWITNLTATLAGTQTVTLAFGIAGGQDGEAYDVFATGAIVDPITNGVWTWLGQSYHCTTNSVVITNPPPAVFLLLGTGLDSDLDGLTDAYEKLVSKTDPQLWDTDGDGKGDGVEIVSGTDPRHYDEKSPLELPAVGSSYLRILAPDLLEMVRISADTNTWNFVSNGLASPPATSQFQVQSGGSSISVSEVGFKRQPLYAPFEQYDLRIENTLYLRLASTNWATSNATIEVTTTNTSLWSATNRFVSVNRPLRYSPTIHVNQAGYLPNSQKKAMVGYYLGNLGEMQISTNLGFKIVDASGTQAYPSFGLATLKARPDDPSTWSTIGTNSQAQYQNVLEADFSIFTMAGQYKLVVPGLGASYPFWIHDGSLMSLARTYALGLYHQRCGGGPGGLQVNDALFTRFAHGNCHVTNATVPLPVSSYASTWQIMSNNYGRLTSTNDGVQKYEGNSENPPQIAPVVTNYSAFLFPYSNNPVGGIDVSSGHHDAGDYSKYTINSALLIHMLTFAADNLGLTNLYNFGLPESTNTIPDILDEARIEADFLAKLQDSDGGFYFLVYPRDQEYEGYVLPQNGDPQIVWPKTTSATASAVGALAEIGSSPAFRKYIGTNVADNYLAKAQLGWTFLSNAIAKSGKAECYQRITTYGDDFTHDDELAWAAAALYAATTNSVYSNKLYQWFPNPTDGHNGYNFKRYDSTDDFPASSNLFVAVAYKTNDLLNTTNKMWFTIWDAAGQKVVTNRIETAIPHIGDIVAISNRLFALKTNFNAHPDDLNRNDALNGISSLVGECHNTWKDGWVRCFAGYGCAVRAYAFAARSGRLSTNALNSAYLQQCEAEILARGTNVRTWSTNNAYGTSLDNFSKERYDKGWFFAGEQAFDLTVADKLQSDPGNVPTIIENLNFEAGRNPMNVSRLTGVGSYQQREIVHQFAQNNPLSVLPPSGVPLGNIASLFDVPIASSAWHYGFLDPICSPRLIAGSSDKTSFPFYERWSETYNVHTEFVHLQTARGLISAAYLVTTPSLRTQVWSRASGTIQFPNGLPAFGRNCTAQLTSTQDLSQAQILWDPARMDWNFYGQNPAIGTNFTFLPYTVGERTISAEALLPDGRRVFAVTNFPIWDPVSGGTNFVNDANTIALYHFDTNLLTDATTNGYNLTNYGNVVLTNNSTWMGSPSGGVARFFNAGDYLFAYIPSSKLLPTNGAELTVEARIYPRAYKGDGKHIASLWGTYGGTNFSQFALYYGSGKYPDAPQVWANCCPMLDNATWSQHVTLNTWHQLKITFDSSGITRAYIDGVLRNSTNNPVTYNIPNSWELTLGNFDGDIDEVRISNVVRP